MEKIDTTKFRQKLKLSQRDINGGIYKFDKTYVVKIDFNEKESLWILISQFKPQFKNLISELKSNLDKVPKEDKYVKTLSDNSSINRTLYADLGKKDNEISINVQFIPKKDFRSPKIGLYNKPHRDLCIATFDSLESDLEHNEKFYEFILTYASHFLYNEFEISSYPTPTWIVNAKYQHIRNILNRYRSEDL